ncbi:juxtaposed with another zinc finger protein 1 [Plutella xylostella]|uniref:juxtaposed with another zinc finger protein 1 n=1 Tax=Plutella xylostella TaxID=51655 RepID=UPI002032DA2A|nr:juxtaposed with another zinc finger protein 1 [Plutella xylostella]
MAVFMINICKFNSCGITFPSLGDLIQHIEDTHIDYDPAVVEQKEASQPSCIPLSYILRFFTENTRREFQSMPPIPEGRRRLMSAPKTPSIRSSTPTGSELDDEEMMTQSEDSNDSWTTVEEYSSEYILRYGVKQHSAQMAQAPLGAPQDKPFACPVPGCKKRYKNVNGIKYHSKNGHKKDGKIKKTYKCHCGKSYKTAQGLKNHSVHHGASALLEAKPKQPGLVVTAAHRPISILDAVDNKLVRIYDSLKTKDLPSLTIPKHNLKTVDYTGQFIRNGGILTPNSTPGSSPVDKIKYGDRSPKVMVQSQPLAPLTPSAEQVYIHKM